MRSLTIHKMDDDLAERIEDEAAQQKTSLNQVVKRLLRRALGLAEQRDGDEVTEVFGTAIAPSGAPAANFAFDVTPNELIAAIITDEGVLRAPYEDSIRDAFARQGS